MTDDAPIKVGDRVRLADVTAEATGVVVELLADDVARVEWTTGKGVVGLRTLHPVRSLRRLGVV